MKYTHRNKNIRHKHKFFYFLSILFLSSFTLTGSWAQTISLTQGELPSLIAPAGDNLDFTINIFNSTTGTSQSGAYMDITVPEKWSFVSTNPESTHLSNNVYRITGINIPANGQQQTITVTLLPLCDVENEESSILYELYASDGTPIASSTTGGIGNVMHPILNIAYPENIVVTIGKRSERNWSVTQTANSYVKELKIDILCDVSAITFHDILYKKSDGEYVSIGMNSSRFVEGTDRYTIFIDENILQDVVGNNKLEYGERIDLREIVSYTSCAKSGYMDYKVYYGNGSQWCLYGENTNSLNVPGVSFNPWIEWVRGARLSNGTMDESLHTYPKKSNAATVEEGRGKRIYRIANTETDQASVMRDLRAKLYTTAGYLNSNNNAAYIHVYTAYFTDAQGNRIPGTPDIPVDNLDIPDRNPANTTTEPSNAVARLRQYVIRFDETYKNGFTGHENVPLVNYDNNGSWDDLEPGDSFFFAIEYDIQYLHFKFDYEKSLNFDASRPDYTNGFLLLHRTMVDLYYRNECGLYTNFALPANVVFNTGNESKDPVYPSTLLIDGKKIGVSTNQGETVIGVNKPTVTLDNLNVKPADNVLMSIPVPPYTGGTGRTGFLVLPARDINPNYVHHIEITLPEGFVYNPDVGIRISNNADINNSAIRTVAPGDISVNGRVIKIRNRLYFAAVTYLHVGMEDDGLGDESAPPRDKNMKIAFSFNFLGEPEKEYAYFILPVDYTQIFTCGRIELVDFSSERTTFGWTSSGMNAKADRNTTGINLKAAGPYDDVTHTGLLSINNNLTLDAGEKLKIDISYLSEAERPYFIFPDNEEAVKVYFKAKDADHYTDVASIPEYSLRNVIGPGTDDLFLHKYELDLTAYINNGITLNEDDSIKVEFLTQATQDLPNKPVQLREFQMRAYTQTLDEQIRLCSPLFSEFTVFDYRLGGITGNTGLFNGIGEGEGSLLRLQLGNGESGLGEVFRNEFRPNTLFTELRFELDGIFLISEISAFASGSNAANANHSVVQTAQTILPTSSYQVTYSGGKTFITINNNTLDDPMLAGEFWSSYGNGYYIFAKFRYMGSQSSKNEGSFKIKTEIDAVNYPSSTNPLPEKYKTGNDGVNFVDKWDYYKVEIESKDDIAIPPGAEAQWDIRITNKSTWSSSDGRLPYSWLALDCAPGVLKDIVLCDSLGNQLATFDMIEDGKYWVKMRESAGQEYLDITNSNKYYIKATFSSCTTAEIKATYGMSSIEYPTNPWAGYSQEYSTTMMLNTTTIPFILDPGKSDFSMEITGDPTEVQNGIYPLCEPFTIIAGFKNGENTELSNLYLRVRLRAGLEYSDFVPQISIGGTDNFQENSNITVTETAQYIEIKLPEDLTLGAYGTPGADVYLKFKMIPMCGFDGGAVYMAAYGLRGCGTYIPKPVNTRRIPVSNMLNPPSVTAESITIKDANNNVSDAEDKTVELIHTPVKDGIFELTVNYKWENYYSDYLYAYIEIPSSLEIVKSGSEDIYLTSTLGDSYKSAFEIIDNGNPDLVRYRALMKNISGSGFIPANYTATFKLKPVNPADWECDVPQNIENWVAVVSSTPCGSTPCDVLEVIRESTSGISYEKISDIELNIEGLFYYQEPKKIKVKGKLTNDLGEAFSFPLTMKFFVDVNGEYASIGDDYYFTKVFTPTDLNFESEFFDFNGDDICRLVLMLKAEDNPYLCEDIVIPLSDKITCILSDNDIQMCSGSTENIGDPVIDGYIYEWVSADGSSPLSYIQDKTTSRTEFNAPVTDVQKVFKYNLLITRPEGCVNIAPLTITVNHRPAFNVRHICPQGMSQVDLSGYVDVEAGTDIHFYTDAGATQLLSSTIVNAIQNATYYVKATTSDAGDLCAEIVPIRIVVSEIVVWSPQNNVGASADEKRNWNDPKNWNIGVVPLECTDVYIPGDVDYFPYLDDENGAYACRNIYFMHGGEIGQPQRLNYEKAHVQLNFGLQDPAKFQNTITQITPGADTETHLAFSAGKTNSSLSRNHWHMLSAPLHGVVSGDFAFGGYPLSFIRKFDSAKPESGVNLTGKWTTFYHNYNEELKAGEGFILWMNKWDDKPMYQEYNESADKQGFASRKYGLSQVNGIIELPYYEDPVMVRARRSNKTSGNISAFNYLNKEWGPDYMTLLQQQDSYDRGNNDKGYRFVVESYDNVNSKWQFNNTTDYAVSTDGTAQEILIGNPYMSTIDFKAFYETNKNYIEPQYRLWTGSSFSTVKIENGNIVSTGNVALDEYIPPIQSFFILTKVGQSDFNIRFDVTTQSVARPAYTNSKLKSIVTRNKNTISIVARNGSYSSEAVISKSDTASDKYVSDEDIYKLFTQNGNVPEIYTYTDGYSLEMNYIRSESISIPVGLKTEKTGDIELTISGMNDYDADKIEFVDTITGKSTDITGKSKFEYKFDNKNKGTQNERFFIRISK